MNDRPNQAPLVERWLQFTAERFPPVVNGVLVGAFFAGNRAAALVHSETGAGAFRTTAAFLAVLLVFFRLRITDEIKDLDTDRRLHPRRPLARGLISAAEAGRMVVVLAALECLLALGCGIPGALAWAVLAVFTWLMKREFFRGAWLAPRRELYAVTHTFSAVLLGVFVATALSGRVPGTAILFGVVNWALFNLFEFSRKTFGREEEGGEPSYSRRNGPRNAALLSVSQVFIAGLFLLMLGHAADRGAVIVLLTLAVMIPVLLAAAVYIASPRGRWAKVFRVVSMLSTAAAYVGVALCLGR